MEIEDCDPLDDGIDDDLFGLTKGLVKFFCPNEFLLWAKQRFELCHNLTETIVMSDLINEPKPRPDVSNIARHGKFFDCVDEIFNRFDFVLGDTKACKGSFLRCATSVPLIHCPT